MAFCPKCGTQIADDTQFCPSCGAAIGAQPAAEAKKAESFKEKVTESAPEFEAEEIEAGQGWSILAYLGIAVLFPIFLAKKNRYARFNANQGLVLLILAAAASVISSIFSAISSAGAAAGSGILIALGLILSLPFYAVSLFALVLTVIAIIAVCRKQVKSLPVVGKIKILK